MAYSMAARPLAIDKENLADKVSVKPNAAAPLQIHKKTALEDVKDVNRKVTNFKKPLQKEECDKAKMAIPKPLAPKPVVAVKPMFKRQESILKNVPLGEALRLLPQPTQPIVRAKSSESAFSTQQLEKVSEEEKGDPLMVTEYISDIFEYLRGLEAKYPIRKGFLEGHPTTPKMRAILVNWLVEIHHNFKLYLETLHLSVALVDRYLQINKNVARNVLQLLGTAALYIASKYEEMYMPPLEDFVYICDDAFTTRQLLLMEIDILKRLDFSLGRPLPIHFLRRYSKMAKAEVNQYLLGKYLLELALLEYEMSHVPPSLLAAAACCLSIAICTEVMDLSKVWTPVLAACTSYKYSDIKPVMVLLADILHRSEVSKYQAVRKKYAAPKLEKISLDHRLKGPLVRKLAMSKK